MSALVVDTSSWIAWLAGGGSGLVDEALDEGRLHLPVIVSAELLSGRLDAAERAELQDMLSQLPAVGTDPEHWFRVGKLRAELRARGLSVSTPDAHVAQCTIDTRGVLLTEDRVFEKIAKAVRLPLA
ncbi:MAG TPA: PIN domain-containing protein [Vicinamibacteria bacterium]|nr:PIN domain-containing protein [Vicinamibacteria bacterium]